MTSLLFMTNLAFGAQDFSSQPKLCFDYDGLKKTVIEKALSMDDYFDRLHEVNARRRKGAAEFGGRQFDRSINYRLNYHSKELIKNPYTSDGELLRALNKGTPL